ncbi:small ribosomal subunit protein bS16m [Phymastichus coffea]|uniref:small ribosomal subunit protein bS16m n=1 Tax=Phymastichus coffea TaxID=108790 RepID=UPI00273B45BD|nr:small ribosomal subunit protein bS16m [Phymastichus coffea]
MPRIAFQLASGSGLLSKFNQKTIRFVKYGCTNRPFYHIVLTHVKSKQKTSPIEQLGTYDSCVNIDNEKLVAFDSERIQYWVGHGARISRPILEILGVSGFLPIHPRSYIKSWRRRNDQKLNNN